jgi:hypothetical protein
MLPVITNLTITASRDLFSLSSELDGENILSYYNISANTYVPNVQPVFALNSSNYGPIITSSTIIAKGDLFQDNCEVNFEKVSYLYVPSLTECSPNDPFNDWTLDTCVAIIYIYSDFVDGIITDPEELDFYDQTLEYEGNEFIDV